MRVFIDDIKDPPPEGSFNEVCRDIDSAIKLVQSGKVSFISFDHDLGQGEGRDAIEVAKEIEKLAQEHKISPIYYEIHSGNSVGKANIDAAMQSAWRFWKEDIHR